MPGHDPDAGCLLCAVPRDEWTLHYRGGNPVLEGTRETLLTLGNGYLATRGAHPESSADLIHCPGTYVAGVYNRLVSKVDGRTLEDESMVNLPNWLPMSFRAEGGAWFAPGAATVRHEHRALDLHRGVLAREVVVCDAEGRRTRVRQWRLVSMANSHLAALKTMLIPENWSGRLDVYSRLDARVTNGNVASFAGLANRHLSGVTTGFRGADTMWLTAETSQSRVRVALSARTRVRRGDRPVPMLSRGREEIDTIGEELTLVVHQGQQITVDKTVGVFTSHDQGIFEPLCAAEQEVTRAGDFDTLLVPHVAAWEQLWRRFHLRLADGDAARLAVNTHLLHLIQTLSPHTADLDVGVPARGLHGEGYRGHIFWDEIFVLPYLNLHLPELSRSLLRYRYRRLPQARKLAGDLGLRGARFPWQSGSDGREETPRTFYNPRSRRWMADNSRLQYHVGLAVAYNVWQYWETTGDLGFLTAYGAEMLVEIARFWASIATYDPADDRYDIRGVMGPDEFHDGYPDRPGLGIDNSAYVNVMAAWVLKRAVDAHRILGAERCAELWQRLDVSEAELAAWEQVSTRLRVSFLGNGILGQFEGFDQLVELDWDGYRARYGNIGRLDLILEAEGDSTNRYRASKQADVLMLLYLFPAEELTGLIRQLGYDFDPATIPATVDYYLARTSHGSTLSRIAHSWVLARTNRRNSWRMFTEALDADLADTQDGTTREGIHLGAMAGTLDILQRCYTGLDPRCGSLWLHPVLPDELRLLEFDLRYRDHTISVRIDHGEVSLSARPSAAAPISVTIDDVAHTLAPGDRLTVPLQR